MVKTEFITSEKVPKKIIKPYLKSCNKHIIDPLFKPFKSCMCQFITFFEKDNTILLEST